MPSYVTLASPATGQLEVRRSRFVADVLPVTDEPRARAAIEGVRARSRDARHHCTAFVLGPDGAVRRSNDDGEPSGTAGAPILEALTAAGLTDVVAVVTRWFGGVLLGTGGLTRAYGDATRVALDAATLRHRELREVHEVRLGHADAPRVEHALRAEGVLVTDTAYDADGVRLTVAGTPGSASVATLVATLTSGASRPTARGSLWVDAS